MALTKDEALTRLRALSDRDPESIHAEADSILLDLIDDDEIRDAWDSLPKWYA